MADAASRDSDSDGDETTDARYRAPEMKTLSSMIEKDKEDESLNQYKQKLLGTSNPINLVLWPSDPRRVIPQRLTFVVTGRPDIDMDLTDLGSLKQKKYVIKEGCTYRLRFHFYVQREIVTGFKYVQKVHKKGIKIATAEFVAGSFGPSKEQHTFISGMEEAPSGLLARSSYTVKSSFTDIDKNVYLKWDWKMEIKKDWPS